MRAWASYRLPLALKLPRVILESTSVLSVKKRKLTTFNLTSSRILSKAGSIATMATGVDAPTKKHQNRLAKEKSPYLLQHANNPVDW